MDLIVHHMFETLVEDRTHKDGGRHLLAGRTAIHHLIRVRLQSQSISQCPRQSVHAHIRERRTVAHHAPLRTDASHERLH